MSTQRGGFSLCTKWQCVVLTTPTAGNKFERPVEVLLSADFWQNGTSLFPHFSGQHDPPDYTTVPPNKDLAHCRCWARRKGGPLRTPRGRSGGRRHAGEGRGGLWRRESCIFLQPLAPCASVPKSHKRFLNEPCSGPQVTCGMHVSLRRSWLPMSRGRSCVPCGHMRPAL